MPATDSRKPPPPLPNDDRGTSAGLTGDFPGQRPDGVVPRQHGAHREDLPHPDGPVTTNTPPVSPFQRGTQQLGQFRHLAAAAEEQPVHVRVTGATRGTGSARPPSPAPRTRQADAAPRIPLCKRCAEHLATATNVASAFPTA